MAAPRFLAVRFPLPPTVALVALAATLYLLTSPAEGRDSSPIAFPGMDAFGQISGLKKNSSGVATGPRPSKLPQPEGVDGGQGAGFVSQCGEASQQRHGWNNVSPFYDTFATAGHKSLPDVHLAVDSMFRISTRLESLLRDPSGTNLLYSPLGLISTLGQLALAARGRTLDELLGLLLGPSTPPTCASNSNLFHSSFRSVLAQVWSRRGSESYELSVRNALFHQLQPPLDRDFTTRLARDYATEIFPTDFKNSPIYAQQQVNLWAQRASKGKIDQLMPYIPPRTTTAIISSVIYFKAIWENQFNKRYTSKGTFYLDGDHRGRTKVVDFMSGEFELPYVESKTLGCKMVALPYTNNETAMYLLMPLGPSKWKGPRPLPPLAPAAVREEGIDALSTRSALASSLPPLHLSNAYYATSGQEVHYNTEGAPYSNVQPSTGGQMQYAPTSGVTPNIQSYTYQRTSNPQRLKRRQTDPQPEVARAYDNSQCQGVPPRCQPDSAIADSPFSATKLHDLANRLGAKEFNSLVVLAKQSQAVRVSLILPRLSMTSNVKLREALAALGLNAIFSEDADLSGAVNQTVGSGDDGNRWAVNEVWQQSRLEVTEEGTEAASGTAAGIVDYSLDSAIFKANSPFLAVIRHEVTGALIFWASVANPS